MASAGARFMGWVADNAGWLKWVAGAYLALNALTQINNMIAGVKASWLAFQALQAVVKPIAQVGGVGMGQIGGGINSLSGMAAVGAVGASAGAGVALGGAIWSGLMQPALDSEQNKAERIDNKDAMKIGLMKQAFRDQYSMQHAGDMSGFNGAWDQQRAAVVGQATSRAVNITGPITVLANDPQEFATKVDRPTGAPQL